MSDLRELYQEVILDHYKKPHNCKKLDTANRVVTGNNPLCGDQLIVYLYVDGDVIRDISFQGKGCAISVASASMMTSAVKGKTRAEANALFERMHQMVRGELDPTTVDVDEFGELAALSGVSEFPVRVKCASLSWHTMHVGLEGKDETVSTE